MHIVSLLGKIRIKRRPEVYIYPIQSVFSMQTESFLAKYTPNSNSFLYLCAIFLKQNVMIDEKILKEKAEKYLVCFNQQCPKHEYCLRWMVGQYVPCEQISITCVNPQIEKKGGECPVYRDSQPQSVAKGMVHFYDEMPRKLEVAIKNKLIARYTRVGYYSMRKAERPITIDIEREIEKVCRSHGWNDALQFDERNDKVIW